MGSQEVSKPVMITVIAVVALVIFALGWWYFGRPQRYPGYQAPVGGGARPGRMVPGMGMEMQQPAPGGPPPQGGMPPGGAPR